MRQAPTKPRPLAVALNYTGQGAPRVTAKGEHLLAKQIIELAREHGVPLRHDAELSAMLAQLPLASEVPEPLYRAVAEVIAFAYRLRGMTPDDTLTRPAGSSVSSS